MLQITHTEVASPPTVSLVNDQPRTLSTDVASYFGKQHQHVMRQIRTILSNCPESFNASNFGLVKIKDAKGELRPAYSMTKDGFTLLAMGFTGPKALQFKLAYIEAFNQMEARLTAKTAAYHRAAPELKPRKLAQQATSQRQVLEVLKSLGGTGTSRDVARITGWGQPRVQKIMFHLKRGGFIHHKGLTPSTANCKRGLTLWAITKQTPAKPCPRITRPPKPAHTDNQALIKACANLAGALPGLITSLCVVMQELSSSPRAGSEWEDG